MPPRFCKKIKADQRPPDKKTQTQCTALFVRKCAKMSPSKHQAVFWRGFMFSYQDAALNIRFLSVVMFCF